MSYLVFLHLGWMFFWLGMLTLERYVSYMLPKRVCYAMIAGNAFVAIYNCFR